MNSRITIFLFHSPLSVVPLFGMIPENTALYSPLYQRVISGAWVWFLVLGSVGIRWLSYRGWLGHYFRILYRLDGFYGRSFRTAQTVSLHALGS